MKLQDIMETPLPDDWDQSAFSYEKTFKSKIDYAIQRAKKIGKGSSRIAFIIEYQGRQTILKIAMNKKGLAQNEVECKLLSDSFIQQTELVIPIIDYDTNNNTPIWIHTELAEMATENKLCDLMKCPSLWYLIRFAKSIGTKNYPMYKNQLELFTEKEQEICEEYANALADIHLNFDIILDDLSTPKNWGIYKGKPVIIDIGLNFHVANKYYLK